MSEYLMKILLHQFPSLVTVLPLLRNREYRQARKCASTLRAKALDNNWELSHERRYFNGTLFDQDYVRARGGKKRKLASSSKD